MSLDMHICPICGLNMCLTHFDKWWNPDKYDNREISIEALILFCAKYEADWKYFVLYNTLTI